MCMYHIIERLFLESKHNCSVILNSNFHRSAGRRLASLLAVLAADTNWPPSGSGWDDQTLCGWDLHTLFKISEETPVRMDEKRRSYAM